MELIIEYDKRSSFPDYSLPFVKRSNYIAIGYDSESKSYCLIYDEIQKNISIQEVDDLLETLDRISLNQLPKFGCGRDGETYTLKICNGWNSLEFKWWSDTCGEQWSGLIKFREKLIELKMKNAG